MKENEWTDEIKSSIKKCYIKYKKNHHRIHLVLKEKCTSCMYDKLQNSIFLKIFFCMSFKIDLNLSIVSIL